MKRAALLFGIISALSIGALFVSSAYALDYVENDQDISLCYHNGTVYHPCNTSGGFSGSVYQKINVPFNTSYTAWDVYQVDIGLSHNTGSVGVNSSSSVQLLNADLEVIAQSQPRINTAFTTPWTSYTFSPVYHFEQEDNTDAFPKYIKFINVADGTNKIGVQLTRAQYGQPYTGVFASTTPGLLANFFPGYKVLPIGGSSDILSEPADTEFINQLAFRLKMFDGSTVTITSPVNNSFWQNPITIYGTCSAAVELFISNGQDVTYQDYTISNLTCDAGSYSYDAGNLSYGTWDVQASVGDSYASAQFFVNASTTIDLLNNPLEGTEGGTSGYWAFIEDWGQQLQKARPYSYLVDLFNAFQDGYNVATTSSTTMALISFTMNSTTAALGGNNPFDITLEAIKGDAFTQILSAEQWASIQWLMKIALTFPFLVYFYWRIMRFIHSR